MTDQIQNHTGGDCGTGLNLGFVALKTLIFSEN